MARLPSKFQPLVYLMARYAKEYVQVMVDDKGAIGRTDRGREARATKGGG
jgi:hypothetical protein